MSAASVKAKVSAARVDLTTLLTLLELEETGHDLLWVSVRKTTNAPWLLPLGKLLKLESE